MNNATIDTRLIRSVLWLAVAAIATWYGSGTTRAWRARLSPEGVIEQGLVELFGSQLHWAVLIAMVPVVFWATGKRVEAGLAVSAGFLAVGYGVAALTFLLALIGVGLFLELDEDTWQSRATTAAAAMICFALVSPWACAIGAGIVLILSTIKKSVALPTLVALFPAVIASLLLIAFFRDSFPSSTPTLIDAIAAVGIVSLSIPLLAVGVGFAALLLSFGAVHSTAVLAASVGVYVIDAPTEIAPELISEGFAVQSGARFALVNSQRIDATANDGTAVDEIALDGVEIGRADEWILIDRTP